MKILLYNDNPVVRKLVALSAQKTKDDLSVIWSIDELDNGAYDLLIVDDALYSDEVMAELKARVPFKTTLMMATRGSSVPGGFDKVIHKPFLPTDLVDLFSQIEKSVSTSSTETVAKDQSKAINLEEEMEELSDMSSFDDLPDLGDLDLETTSGGIKTNILDHEEVQEVQSLLDDEDAFVLDEPMDGIDGLDEPFTDSSDEDLLEGLGEEIPDASRIDDIDDILEEMNEEESVSIQDDALVMPEMDDLDEALSDETADVEGLDDILAEMSAAEESLEAIEDEEDLDALMVGLDDELIPEAMEEAPMPVEIPQMDDEDFGMDELEALTNETVEDDSFDDAFTEMAEVEEPLAEIEGEEDLDALMVGLDDELIPEAMEEAPIPAEIPQMDNEDFGMDEETSFGDADLEEVAAVSFEGEEFLDEEGMDELEQQIQNAVSELELGDLDMELGEEELDELGIEQLSGLDGLDGLETIDEREMKLAVGESVEEEPEVRIGHGEHASITAEALSEAMGDDQDTALLVKEEELHVEDSAPSTAEGVEALQVLLKTLSNEEVVKSLKGLNISININFGNNA